MFLTDNRRYLSFTNRHQRADSETGAGFMTDAAQLLQPPQAQQRRWRDQTVSQHDHQRGAARDDLGLVAVLAQK